MLALCFYSKIWKRFSLEDDSLHIRDNGSISLNVQRRMDKNNKGKTTEDNCMRTQRCFRLCEVFVLCYRASLAVSIRDFKRRFKNRLLLKLSFSQQKILLHKSTPRNLRRSRKVPYNLHAWFTLKFSSPH